MTNFFAERSSTRISSAPGGKSSIFFGDYDGTDAPPKAHPARKQTPGVASSISLGDSDVPIIPQRGSKKQSGAGASSVCLGETTSVVMTNDTIRTTKKHTAGSTATTISIGDSGPVDPVPPGRKHVSGVSESISLSPADNDMPPPSPTSKKIIPGGGVGSLSLKDSDDPVEICRPSRKQTQSSGAGFSVFRADTVPESTHRHSKKHANGGSSSIDLSDKPVEVHQKNARRQFQVGASELVLADEAPVLSVTSSRKHIENGQSSIRFGEGEVEQYQPGRKRKEDSSANTGMRDCLTRPPEKDETSSAPSSPTKNKTATASAPATPTKGSAPLSPLAKTAPTVASPAKAKVVVAAATPASSKPKPTASSELVMEKKAPAVTAASSSTQKRGEAETARTQPVKTQRPGVRSQQAPGGTSSLVLG